MCVCAVHSVLLLCNCMRVKVNSRFFFRDFCYYESFCASKECYLYISIYAGEKETLSRELDKTGLFIYMCILASCVSCAKT